MTTAKSDSGGAFALVAVVAAVLAIGAALYERSMARAAQAAMLTASRDFAATQSHGRTAASRVSPAEARKQAEAEPAAAADGAPARPANPRPGTSPAEQKEEWQGFLTQHPEVRDQLSAYAKLQFANEFGPFCKSAGFTAAQADQLETMTFEKWFAGLAVGPMGGIRQTGGDLLPPLEQLRGVLGDEGAQKLLDYNRTLPAQGLVSQIAAKAGLASAPLTSDQATQLAQVMLANSPEYADGRGVNLPTVDWTATLAQINSFLTPAQAQAAQRQIVGLQYQTALAQARQAAAGGATSP